MHQICKGGFFIYIKCNDTKLLKVNKKIRHLHHQPSNQFNNKIIFNTKNIRYFFNSASCCLSQNHLIMIGSYVINGFTSRVWG